MLLNGRRTAVVTTLLVTMVLAAAPSSAQSARVRGVVTDSAGQPVADATVVVVFQGALALQSETATNDVGAFVLAGLMRGPYVVTVTKEGFDQKTTGLTLQSSSQSFELNVELLTAAELARENLFGEDLAEFERTEAATDAIERGIQAARNDSLDEAVTLFNEAIEILPDCSDCYRNLGIVYALKDDYAQAEAAFERAIELAPDNAAAYEAVIEAYNQQGKFAEAAEANAQAIKLSGSATGGGAGGVTAVFNQGVILWNSDRFAEARQQFEQTLMLDPNHSEAHYWLGMANLNEGKMPEAAAELTLYLEREPDGRYTVEATGFLAMIQP